MSFRGCVGAESKGTAVVSLLVGKGVHRSVAVHHTIGRTLFQGLQRCGRLDLGGASLRLRFQFLTRALLGGSFASDTGDEVRHRNSHLPESQIP